MSDKRGMFITLEGGEGAGKSTNIAVIVDELSEAGIPCKITREPGGTELGEKLRELLLGTETDVEHDAELLLMFAARTQHVQSFILPNLAQGHWVVCDRFTDSTYAYQGWGRGVPLERIAQLETWVQGDLRPDRTLLFDLPIETGMERARSRADLDRFEKEDLDFMRRVRSGFQALASQQPDRIRVINAEQTPDLVADQVRAAIRGLVKQWKQGSVTD